MSNPNNPFNVPSEDMFEEQLGRISSYLHHQNALLEVMAEESLLQLTENFDEIVELQNDGLAEEVLHIGTQINLEWKDVASDTTYVVPHDIVHYGDIMLEDGETTNGMFLSWHYCTPFGITFDAREAFFAATDAVLPAGTYNVIMGLNWGTYVVKDKVYQFTTTVDVPIGGVLAGFESAPDVAPTSWKVKVCDASRAVLETVDVTEGSSGTNLGTFTAAGEYGGSTLNSIQAVAYGLNRDKDSALRQWLNSEAGVGAWWSAQHKYDMPPAEAATKAGFLTGYAPEIRRHFAKTKIRTAQNTVSADGSFDEYYDRVFSPSKEQIYNTPQIAGEGEYWEYWRRALGRTSPTGTGSSNIYPAYKIYAINAKTSAQTVRLRSANRGYAHHTWYVNSGGYVGSSNAYYAYRALPSLVIAQQII